MNVFRSKDEFTETDFKLAFDNYQEQIKNYVYYKSRNLALAEDLVQEVFITLWTKRASIKKDTLLSYLYKIANNLFLNEIKHRKVVSDYEFNYDGSGITNQDPEYLLEEKEFEKKLFSIINSIPEKSKTVFLMNRIDKLSYTDIAERLNISSKAVEKRMQKALSIVRQISEKI